MSQQDDRQMAVSVDDELSFVHLIRLFTSHWRFLVGAAALCGVIAALVSLLMTPLFAAKVSLLPRQQQAQQNILGQLASLTNISLGEGSSYEALYGQIVTSDRILDRLLEKQWPRFEGDDPRLLIEILGTDRTADGPDDWTDRARFKAYLRRNVISFERRNTTGYMQIKVMVPRWPELAASLANGLAEELDMYIQELSRNKASEQRRFITDRLVQIQVELDAAASRLTEFEFQNRSYETSPILRRQHADLSREVQVQSALWTELKRQLEVAKIDEHKDVMAIDVLDTAKIPFVRSAPNRTLIAFCGAVLGFILGCLWVLVRKRSPLPVS